MQWGGAQCRPVQQPMPHHSGGNGCEEAGTFIQDLCFHGVGDDITSVIVSPFLCSIHLPFLTPFPLLSR